MRVVPDDSLGKPPAHCELWPTRAICASVNGFTSRRPHAIPLPFALPGLNAASARVIVAGYRRIGFVHCSQVDAVVLRNPRPHHFAYVRSRGEAAVGWAIVTGTPAHYPRHLAP
jgi:hypothetical protein